MHIAIVGSGISGLTLALSLQKLAVADLRVTVYDRAAQLTAAGSGMSIIGHSLVILRSLGIDLDRIGVVQHDVRLCDVQLRTRLAVPLNADLQLTREFSTVQVNVHRGQLHAEMVRVFTERGGRILTKHKLESYAEQADALQLFFADRCESVRCDVLVGADGIWSAVRAASGLSTAAALNYSGYCCWRGLVDVERLENSGARHMYKTISGGALSSFTSGVVRGNRRFWALDTLLPRDAAVADKRAYCLRQAEAGGYHADVLDIIASTDERDILQTDVFDCTFYSPVPRANVVLLGDAAHPLVHHFGQGACLAIEDGAWLARCFAENAGDSVAALAQFNSRWYHWRARALVLISRVCGLVYMHNAKWRALRLLLDVGLLYPFVLLFVWTMKLLLFVCNRSLRDYFDALDTAGGT